jgi:serine/threonine protein kinase
VHQDVKPGNVLLTKSGRVFLSDFGISHSFDTGAAVFGTLFYQAPEVLDSVEDPACERGKEDIWALGITLFEMIFRAVPFQGADIYAIIAAIRKTSLSPPRSCDPEIWKLICGMLMVDPRERWNIEEVMESEFVKGAPSQADFSGFPEKLMEEIDPVVPIVEAEAVV